MTSSGQRRIDAREFYARIVLAQWIAEREAEIEKMSPLERFLSTLKETKP